MFRCYEIVLHSKDIQTVFEGRISKPNKPHIPGFFRFAKIAQCINDDAKHNYPYAVWWKTKLAEQQSKITKKFENIEKHWIKQVPDDLKVHQPSPDWESQIYTINTQTILAANQIDIITQADQFIILLSNLEKQKIIRKKEYFSVKAILQKKIRGTHVEATKYHPFPVKIQDIQNETEVYEEARKKMGVFPRNILDTLSSC